MYIPLLSTLLLLHFASAARKGGSSTENEDTIFSSSSTYSLNIEHAFGVDAPFTPKGTIIMKVHRTTSASFSRETKLSLEEVTKLEDLAVKDGLYRIRAPVKLTNTYADEKEKTPDTDGKYVSSFTKACHLFGSNLKEKITVSIDDNGNVIGISLMSPKQECPIHDLTPLTSHVFNSTVSIHSQVAGAVPDTQTFVKKLEKEQAEQAAGKGKENKSFLAKYWMYIVPIFLILMLSSQAEPEQGGGGGGGGN